MTEDVRAETVDMVVTFLEKYPGNFEVPNSNIGSGKKCKGNHGQKVRNIMACSNWRRI